MKYAVGIDGTWDIEEAEQGDSDTASTDINLAVDSMGNAYIVYSKHIESHDRLFYASNQSDSWDNEVIDPTSVVGQASMAIDSNDAIHISYYGSYGDMKYATNQPGTWIWDLVDYPDSMGTNNDLDVDSSGNVHICYYYQKGGDDPCYWIKYANNTLGMWEIEVVDDSEGQKSNVVFQ